MTRSFKHKLGDLQISLLGPDIDIEVVHIDIWILIGDRMISK